MRELVRKLPKGPTQVFLLVENRLVREALGRLFRKRSDLRVVGLGCSTDAVDEILNSQCDIVVLDDLHAASLYRLRLLDRLQTTGPVGVVLIDMQDDEKQFLTAVRSGVSGYVLSDARASDVVSAVRAVARGEAVCPPRLRLALFRFVARASKEKLTQIKTGPMHGLTMRQQQLISLVARGLTNKEIASQLNLSEFTVKNHLHRIMLRCGRIVAALRSWASIHSNRSASGSVSAS
jgi:DNA-binding NarL/FixJ family response regulator